MITSGGLEELQVVVQGCDVCSCAPEVLLGALLIHLVLAPTPVKPLLGQIHRWRSRLDGHLLQRGGVPPRRVRLRRRGAMLEARQSGEGIAGGIWKGTEQRSSIQSMARGDYLGMMPPGAAGGTASTPSSRSELVGLPRAARSVRGLRGICLRDVEWREPQPCSLGPDRRAIRQSIWVRVHLGARFCSLPGCLRGTAPHDAVWRLDSIRDTAGDPRLRHVYEASWRMDQMRLDGLSLRLPRYIAIVRKSIHNHRSQSHATHTSDVPHQPQQT